MVTARAVSTMHKQSQGSSLSARCCPPSYRVQISHPFLDPESIYIPYIWDNVMQIAKHTWHLDGTLADE